MRSTTDTRPPVLLIGGPTAAGKSGLAVQIAEAFSATVVSADAMTVWRGLDIGTAKPSREEQARVPHRCIDIRDLHEEFNVSDFVDEVDRARNAMDRVIVAGGTPFYLSALVRPMAELPPPNPAIRAELEGLAAPWQVLKEVDPVMADKLHPNDRVRVIRALEVFRVTGRPMSVVQAGPPSRPPISCEIIWLDRDDLRDRIARRIEGMVGDGYVDETRRILEIPGAAQHRALRSFAYRHLVEHISDGMPLHEALRRTDRDTWYLARKQRTWARGLGWAATTPDAAWQAAERLWGPRGSPDRQKEAPEKEHEVDR